MIADLSNVDVMLKPVYWVIEFCEDGVNGWIVKRQVDCMVEGMDGNAGWPLGWHEADCLFGSSNGLIAFIMSGWDIVWVRLLIIGSSGRGSRHCTRSKHLLELNYHGIYKGLLMCWLQYLRWESTVGVAVDQRSWAVDARGLIKGRSAPKQSLYCFSFWWTITKLVPIQLHHWNVKKMVASNDITN
jgi:hypothetical protein